MQPILNLHTWVSLPSDVRNKVRALFQIPRSANVFVNDGKIETDGTTNEDFKALTVEKMQTYLTSDLSDFHRLFDMVVAKVIEELNPVTPPAVTPIQPETNVKKTNKKVK